MYQNNSNNEVELAKSWYQLAIVFATLAGMTIVAAGMFWQPMTSLTEPIKFAKEMCSPLYAINSSVSNLNFTDCYSQIIDPLVSSWGKTIKISTFFMCLSTMLALSSVYIWSLGFFRLRYGHKLGKQFVIWLVLMLLIIFFAGYKLLN